MNYEFGITNFETGKYPLLSDGCENRQGACPAERLGEARNSTFVIIPCGHEVAALSS